MNRLALASRPAVSALVYAAAVAALVTFAVMSAFELQDGQRRLEGLQQRLAALEGRRPNIANASGAGSSSSTESPFLEARTVTLAGADLQRRLEQAAAKANAAVSSEQIDLAGPGAKDGFILLTASLEIAQPALQGLIYDLETGMPYLFIESLDIQSPLATGGDAQGPMRVTLSISGKWETPP